MTDTIRSMRQRLAQWADRAGVRSTVARQRDRLVDLLEGRSGNHTIRRNSIDDRNLKLLISFCLRPDSNWLEVGANRGKFLHDVQRVAPLGHHVVYEPVPNQSERLHRLFPGMDIRQRALSNENGQSGFVRVLDPGAQGLSRLEEIDDPLPGDLHTETLLVTTERLDDARPEGWLPHFVKIDVEGAELDVLHGAIATLRTARPVIAFEHGRRPGVTEEIFALLCHDVGLRMFDMDGHGPLTLTDFLDATRERWNWVAHR